MALTRLHVAADCGFWPAAAQAVLEFARDHGAQERQLGALMGRAQWCTGPMCPRRAARGFPRSAILPRVVPLVTWLGDPEDSGIEARVEIFSALRSNEWIARSFGEQSETLWSLASDVARICDELTLAAVDQPEALEERLQASLARHFGRRAGRVLQAPAQLVLRLWRARREAGDGAARMIAALAARAAALQGPLVYLSDAIATAEATAVEPWERAFVERAAARSEVLHLVPDVAMALTTAPMLGAAWPELTASGESAPIAARAQALLGRASVPPVVLTCGASLEETASVVAQQTLRWLGEGRATIALVALDRLLARRVRALLERAEVLVRDETGWKLSTTSAAASIMRWLDLVRDDFYWRDLLDWLKSSFTLADRAGKAHEVAVIERAIRSSGVVQGAQAIRRALTEAARHDDTMLDRAAYDQAPYHRALEVLRLVEAEVQATQRATNTLSGQLRALRHAMTALGMQTGLDADPVGRAVLAELDRLDHQLASQRAAATLADFRALLVLRFEEVAYVDTAVESPVAMVTLAAAALRDFDAVALVGADASHLPTTMSELLFMSNAVRAELGWSPPSERALKNRRGSRCCWPGHRSRWLPGAPASATSPIRCHRFSSGCSSSAGRRPVTISCGSLSGSTMVCRPCLPRCRGPLRRSCCRRGSRRVMHRVWSIARTSSMPDACSASMNPMM
jgi:ATP-dependent helicase/nuclease subunit B